MHYKLLTSFTLSAAALATQSSRDAAPSDRASAHGAKEMLLRPRCMDHHAPYPPQWCLDQYERHLWCLANKKDCQETRPWLYNHLLEPEDGKPAGGPAPLHKSKHDAAKKDKAHNGHGKKHSKGGKAGQKPTPKDIQHKSTHKAAHPTPKHMHKPATASPAPSPLPIPFAAPKPRIETPLSTSDDASSNPWEAQFDASQQGNENTPASDSLSKRVVPSKEQLQEAYDLFYGVPVPERSAFCKKYRNLCKKMYPRVYKEVYGIRPVPGSRGVGDLGGVGNMGWVGNPGVENGGIKPVVHLKKGKKGKKIFGRDVAEDGEDEVEDEDEDEDEDEPDAELEGSEASDDIEDDGDANSDSEDGNGDEYDDGDDHPAFSLPASGAPLSTRPACMDRYPTGEVPEWCTAIQARRQRCAADESWCEEVHPWLSSAMGFSKET